MALALKHYGRKLAGVKGLCIIFLCKVFNGTALPQGVHRFIGKASEIAQNKLGLTDSDLVGYIALAMYFGAEFAHDPLYPWAKEAFTLTDADERRHQLGEQAFGFFEVIWRDDHEQAVFSSYHRENQ
jgi:hypothetical protein